MRKPEIKYVMLCAICYHLYNLKNMKNTDGGVLLLVVKYYKWHSSQGVFRDF